MNATLWSFMVSNEDGYDDLSGNRKSGNLVVLIVCDRSQRRKSFTEENSAV